MAITLEELIVEVDADTKGLNDGLKQTEKGLSKFGNSVKKIGGLIAGAFAAKVVIDFSKESIKAAQAQERAEARLASIATTVTKANDEQVESLKRLAAAQQQVTTFGDEVLIAGQSQLLSFGLQTDQVEQLTGSLADLLAANKGVNATQDDAINAANLLGKAFSGQAGALSRVGILLDDTQSEILKNGDAAEKTAALVEILEQNYGGLSKELAQTTEGQIVQAKNAFGDFKETIGNLLLPALGELASFATTTVLPALQGFAVTFKDDIIPFIGEATNSFRDFLVKTFKPFRSELINVADNFVELGDVGQSILEAIGSGIETFGGIAQDVFDAVGDDYIWFAIEAFKLLQEEVKIVLTVISAIITAAFEAIQDFWDKWGDDILTSFEEVFDGLEVLFDNLKKVLAAAQEFWDEWGDEIIAIVKTVFSLVTDLIGVALTVITSLVKAFIALITGDWDQFFTELFETAKFIWDLIKNAFEEGIAFIKSIDFNQVGKDLISGLINGVKSGVNALVREVKKAAESAVSAAKDVFGINSPSKVFAGIGEDVTAGFVKGIDSSRRLAELSTANLASVATDAATGTTNNQNVNMTSNNSVVVQNLNVREEEDINKTARQLFNLQESKNRATGLVPLGV